jgi:cobalamin transport system substrate-binding protein
MVVDHTAIGSQVLGSSGSQVRAKRPKVLLAILILLVGVAITSAGPKRAMRVVSLVPAVTEMLFAMGAGDDVVGVSSYDNFPPEVKSKSRVGALVDPDFERILSLRPELVIVYGTQIDLMARLERARVPMFRYEHAGLADITATVRAVGNRIGRADSARALADQMERELADTRKRVAGRPRPRAVLIFGREAGSLRGIYASGGVGFMHDMLEVAGGEDIFADVKRQNLEATTEMLLTRAPDVIIEVHSGDPWPADRITREQAAWNGLPSLPAVRSRRVHIVVDDRLSIPGPRIGAAVRLLADVLHPAK